MDSSILIVDDQLGVRRLLFETFTDDGYTVQMAASGYEALDKLKDFQPGLVLLDMKMPKMNGLETLRKIRKMDPNQPVIMMTAYEELEIVAEAMKLGVKEYITKPFDIYDLKLRVKQILKQATREDRTN